MLYINQICATSRRIFPNGIRRLRGNARQLVDGNVDRRFSTIDYVDAVKSDRPAIVG